MSNPVSQSGLDPSVSLRMSSIPPCTPFNFNARNSFLAFCDGGKFLAAVKNILKAFSPHWAEEKQVNPNLQFNVSHTANDYLVSGDHVKYHFNISHGNQSSVPAKNVTTIWYLPEFLQFERIKNEFEGLVVEKIHGTSNIQVKVASVPLLENVYGEILIKFDPQSSLGKWHHKIAIAIRLLWYGNDENNVTKRYQIPLIPYSIEVMIPGCIEPLGMLDGRIKDHQFFAKYSDPALQPWEARPNGDAWCSKDDTVGHYFQVSFRKKTRVSLIVTWGRNRKDQWGTKYNLNYSIDGYHWLEYKENGFPKALDGYAGPKKAFLLYPVVANSIRIMPIKWKERICMRFELHGCEIESEENCINPVGIQNGLVPEDAFSHSITTTVEGNTINPSDARLGKNVTLYPHGWMARSNLEDWLQIDLGSVFTITKYAIQGSATSPIPLFYVKTYKVTYSITGIIWNKVIEDGKEKIFDGPRTAVDAIYPTPAILGKPIKGRYFRIVPIDFISRKVMRIELYGCVWREKREHFGRLDTDLDLKYSRRSVLLDPVRNIFYACFRQSTEAMPSCLKSNSGKIWEELDSSITRLLGINIEKDILYGTDRQLSYHAKESHGNFAVINRHHWFKASEQPVFLTATQLPDILVGQTPKGVYQWIGINGISWGVSGDGIHTKDNANSTWELVASWKCCGF